MVKPPTQIVLHRNGPFRVCCNAAKVVCTAVAPKEDWRKKAKPIKPGSTYPAKEYCSNCGLCDTYYVAHVKDACAFLGDGKSLLWLINNMNILEGKMGSYTSV